MCTVSQRVFARQKIVFELGEDGIQGQGGDRNVVTLPQFDDGANGQAVIENRQHDGSDEHTNEADKGVSTSERKRPHRDTSPFSIA